MRSKAPLALMEQLVMVLVFALAAALCVQAFVLSDQTSRRNEARDRAVLEAQNAAEELKSVHGEFQQMTELYGGSWNGRLWGRSYDENWKKVIGVIYCDIYPSKLVCREYLSSFDKYLIETNQI